MKKIRVSDLAHELQRRAVEIIYALTELGVTRVVTHSSRLEAEEADKVREHFKLKPREPKVDHVTLGLVKSIAARFGEEI
jgi:Translation initiation factor IF-2, N-terminal region